MGLGYQRACLALSCLIVSYLTPIRCAAQADAPDKSLDAGIESPDGGMGSSDGGIGSSDGGVGSSNGGVGSSDGGFTPADTGLDAAEPPAGEPVESPVEPTVQPPVEPPAQPPLPPPADKPVLPPKQTGARDEDEIIITGRRIANIEQVGTATVITREEILVHGDRTLDQTLDRIPGIEVYTYRKGFSRIRLRGFDQDKVLVLIDGVPVTDLFSTEIDIKSIPLMNIDKIVVTRGVSSALYGTEGTVGTINVITRKPRELFSEVGASYGSYHNASVNMAHGAPVGDFYYWLSAALLYSGGYTPSARLDAEQRRRWFDRIIRYDLYPVEGPFADPPLFTFAEVTTPAKERYIYDTDRWPHSDDHRYFLSAKAGYQFNPDLETGVNANLSYFEGRTNTYQVNAYSSYRGDRWRPNWPYFGDEQGEAKKFALRNRAFEWPFIYRLDAAPYLKAREGPFSLRLVPFVTLLGSVQDGYASADHKYIKGETVLFNGQGVFEPFHDHKTFTSLGVRFLPSLLISPHHRLNFSLHFRHDRYLGQEQAINQSRSPQIYAAQGGDPYPIEELHAQIAGLGVEDELRPLDNLKLVAGVSYDVQNFSHFESRTNEQYERRYIVEDQSTLMGTRDALNPVAGLIFDPVKRRVRLRAAAGIKVRFPRLNEYAKVETSEQDRHLRPERSYNLNAGPEFFFYNETIRLRGDYFLSVIDNRILKLSRDDPPVNISQVVVQGVETAVSAELGRLGELVDIESGASYTFIHARNRDFSQDSNANKGRYLEFTPEHQIAADLGFNFITGTVFKLWATVRLRERIYVMHHRPTVVESAYSTDYFTTVLLHDPVFLNTRLCQSLWDNYEMSVTVLNLLEDYDANPFDPGPGRTFHLSVAARWP